MRGLHKTVFTLGLVSFFTDFSSEMIYPLLPVFLTTVLHSSSFAIGIIEGVAESTSSFFKLFSGLLTDKLKKRKVFIFTGYLLSGVFRVLISVASTWVFVLIFRFFDRVGKGLRTSPRDTLIADVTPVEKRGRAYGFHRSMDHAGAIVGPLVATLLISVFHFNLKQVFYFAAIPALISILLIYFFVKEKEEVEKLIVNEPINSDLFNFGKLPKDFKYLLISLFVFTLGNSTDAFIILRLADSGLDQKWIPIIWALHSVVKMASTYYIGKLADHFNKRNLIIISWVFYAIIYLLFANTQNLNTIIIVFLIYGLFYGLSEPAERALVSIYAPKRLRGSAFGYFHFISGISLLPSSLIFGFLWQKYSFEYAFTFGALMAFIACLIISFGIKNQSST